MKALFLCVSLSFLFGNGAWADSADDRAAIEKIVMAVFEGASTGRPVSTLFAADADSEFDRLKQLDRQIFGLSHEHLSEVTPPVVVIRSIRFVTPDVALTDAANTQYGSMILQTRIPVLLVLRREGIDWRIVSLRVLVDSREILAGPMR